MAKKAVTAFDPKTFLATVNHGRTVTKCATNALIFAQADAADAVFYIQKGQVKLVVESEQGKEAVVAVLGPEEFFGEGCLIGQALRLATARAMVESEIMRVCKAEMIRVLHDEPSFGELFMAHLLTRNSHIEADLVDQLFNSSEKRLARTLLMLANFGKAGGPQPITTPISQETLARDHRHDTAACQLLHEQVQEARLHRLHGLSETPRQRDARTTWNGRQSSWRFSNRSTANAGGGQA